MSLVIQWLLHYGYVALFVMLSLGIVGVPVPDETALMFSGYACWQGKLNLPATLATAWAGSALGITLSYLIGRCLGRRVIRRAGRYLRITEAAMDNARDWFERWGRWTLVLCYFIPGIRHVQAMFAGSAGLSWPKFAPFAYSGALLWSATFILAGYFLGTQTPRIAGVLHHGLTVASIVIGAVLVAAGVAWWLWARRRNARGA